MKLATKKGFTLIELLVVMTIIAILTTGAVQIFTTQIQRARDTTRIADISTLRGALEQAYQDTGRYPNKWSGDENFEGLVGAYIQGSFPEDPKSGEASDESVFEYLYNVSANEIGITNQEFAVSAHLENSGNISSRAATTWLDPVRLELGINITTENSGNNTSVGGTNVVIPENAANFSCFTPEGPAADCSDNLNPMLIRSN